MQLGRVRSRLRMLYDLIKGVVTIAVCVSFTLALFTLVKVIRCVAYLTYVDRVKGPFDIALNLGSTTLTISPNFLNLTNLAPRLRTVSSWSYQHFVTWKMD
ncbi:hypothetical protein LSH36_93g01045 [Paralvinella palmiformis]|uniref:Uncharacterized protein n=1 Tax=Paralvinella palmiformis TaxID=53620 RepID=A0AAD9NCZ9_9ANNE|nr:hypothetical protein LSH36_93g01045 [Paralvinella palmiformis]